MNNEQLVVWHGDDDIGGLVDYELEIFGQRIAPPRAYPPLILKSA